MVVASDQTKRERKSDKESDRKGEREINNKKMNSF